MVAAGVARLPAAGLQLLAGMAPWPGSVTEENTAPPSRPASDAGCIQRPQRPHDALANSLAERCIDPHEDVPGCSHGLREVSKGQTRDVLGTGKLFSPQEHP